jgi:homocysteine S-methyltransferase
MQRLEQKIEAGAEYVMTQPVYEAETFERFLKAFQGLRQKIPLLIGICPLASLRNAQFLHTEVPGMQIPESVLKRMGQFESTDDQRKVGIEIAREALKLFKADVQGTYVMPPFNRADTAIAVVEDYLVKGAYAHGSRS